MTLRTLFIACLLVLLAACGGDDLAEDAPSEPAVPPPEEGSAADITGNNSAILTGDPLGTGEVSVEELRKPVEVSVAALAPAFELRQGYLVRAAVQGAAAPLFLMGVTNVSGSVQCLPEAGGATFNDASGTALALANTGGVSLTSVGEAASGTTFCLGIGDTGYVTFGFGDIGAEAYEGITQVDIAYVRSNPVQAEAPAARVIPQSYAVADAVTVTVQNEGEATAYIEGGNNYLLLDDADEPLYLGTLLALEGAEGILEPGATLELQDLGGVSYSGTTSKMLPAVFFRMEPF